MHQDSFISALQAHTVMLAAFLESATAEELMELSEALPSPNPSRVPPWELPDAVPVPLGPPVLPSSDSIHAKAVTGNAEQGAEDLALLCSNLQALARMWPEIKPRIQIAPLLADVWYRHVAANSHVPRLAELAPDWPPSLEANDDVYATCQRALRNQLSIETVDDLGNDLFSLMLTGPVRTSLVFSEAALKQADDLERDFVLYHQFAHFLLPDHGPSHTFGFRLEYKRGHTPHELLCDETYLQAERDADDAASCMLYSEYIEQERLSPLSTRVVRGALQHGASVELIRELIRARVQMHGRLVHIHTDGSLSQHSVQCPPVPREALPTEGSLSLVRGRDRHVYLVVKGQDGPAWKHWVCSSRVLARLGWKLKRKPPKILDDRELAAYPELQPLLDPYEVDTLRIARLRWSWTRSAPDLIPGDGQYSEAAVDELLDTLAESIIKRPEPAMAESFA
jgi:hypothetical protein